MVRHAFRVLTDDKIKTRLIAFSDDMDGLRKVPDNVPNKEMLAQHLGKPLTKVPDPFGTHPSFGEHNNARLRAFLDTFGFEYEFMSSTRLLQVRPVRRDAAQGAGALRRGDERSCCRRCARSGRRPIRRSCRSIRNAASCCRCRCCRMTPSAARSPTRSRRRRSASPSPVTGGRCKLQWKPDWAMRWVALGIDYEMAGKDLIDSVKLSRRNLPRARRPAAGGLQLRAVPRREGPEDFQVEGQRPDHRRVAALRQPRKSCRCSCTASRSRRSGSTSTSFRATSTSISSSSTATNARTASSGWAIRSGTSIPASRPRPTMPISFKMLLTLVSSSNAENAETLWGFIGRYRPGVTPQTHPKLNDAVRIRHPLFPRLRAAGQEIPRAERRRAQGAARSARCAVQPAGRRDRRSDPGRGLRDRPPRPFLDEKKKAKDGKPGVSLDWFNMLYQVLLGQEKGPRFGSFVAVYGLKNTVDMIDGALARSA